jgi:glycerophosphoryl diester phosphodiesterase
VHHDADTRRVYGRDLRIADCTAEQLCGTIPQILTLAQVVAEFGRKVHLMIELKAQPGDPAAYAEILQRTLAPLDPVTDYHIISLDPVNTFRAVPFVPARALLPVAELRVARLSSMALDLGWGGLAGHVLVITDATIRRHHDAGQMVGTGFARSRNALWRELGRGVDWVFTDNALQMQTELQRAATASADLRVQ